MLQKDSVPFVRLFSRDGCWLLYCFLLGRVLCCVTIPGTSGVLTSQRAFTWYILHMMVRCYVVTWYLIAWPPPTAPDMNSIIQIKCHKVDAAERLTDSLTVSRHPSHNQPVFTVNLSTNSPLSRPWSEKNTERIVPFSLTVFQLF